MALGSVFNFGENQPLFLAKRNIGEIHTKREDEDTTHAEWRIPEFSSVLKYYDSICYDSPTFSIAGHHYLQKVFIRLYQKSSNVCFHLMSHVLRDISVEYNFGLKKLDGSVNELQGGIMTGNETCAKSRGYVCISELFRQNSELVPGDVLTLTCILTSKPIYSTETMEMDIPIELKLRSLEKLSMNFKDLFSDKDSCDTTLKVKKKEYKAHRLILMARSAVFATTFKHDTLERQTGIITISDCDSASFPLFLDFLYSGQLQLGKLSFRSALNLYCTSVKYDVPELKESCLEYLMHYCLTVENVCDIAIFADKHDEKELFSAVQGFFNENSYKVFLTSDWDDLLAKEPQLANKLIKEMSRMKLQ